jgi:hypothetical protein
MLGDLSLADDEEYTCAARMFRPCLEAFLKEQWASVEGLNLCAAKVCVLSAWQTDIIVALHRT